MSKEKAVLVWLAYEDYKEVVRKRVVDVLDQCDLGYQELVEAGPKALVVTGVRDGYKAALELRGVPGVELVYTGVLIKDVDLSVAISNLADYISLRLSSGERFNVVVESLSSAQNELRHSLRVRILKEVFKRVEGAVIDEYLLDKVFFVFVMPTNSFLLSSRYLTGVGGLPAGVNGRALGLFNGGLNSMMAVVMVARAGYEPTLLFVDPVGLSTEGYVRRAILAAHSLAYLLKAGLRKLYVAPLDKHVTRCLKDKRGGVRLWLFHRVLAEVACVVAEDLGADLIFNGLELNPYHDVVMRPYVDAQLTHGSYFAFPLVFSDRNNTAAALVLDDEELMRVALMGDWRVAEPPIKWGASEEEAKAFWAGSDLARHVTRPRLKLVELDIDPWDPTGGFKMLDEYLRARDALHR